MERLNTSAHLPTLHIQFIFLRHKHAAKWVQMEEHLDWIVVPVSRDYQYRSTITTHNHIHTETTSSDKLSLSLSEDEDVTYGSNMMLSGSNRPTWTD